jgi:peptidoglycan/xylan/chitin deacetylase (PgdA/CDA1 family)
MRSLFLKVFNIFGFNKLFSFYNKNKIRILMYHNLVKTPLPVKTWTSIDAKEFYWQMKYLASNYNVLPLPDIFLSSKLNLQKNINNLVAITFDDGLKSVTQIAEPILEEFNLKAICFVNPGLLTEEDRIWTDSLYEIILGSSLQRLDPPNLGLNGIELNDIQRSRINALHQIKNRLKSVSNEERVHFLSVLSQKVKYDKSKKLKEFALMSKSEIINMHKRGRISIAPHTFTHPILARLSKVDQELEITRSIQELKSWGVSDINIFAYPNGSKKDFNEITISLLKENNIHYALTTIEGFYEKGKHDNYFIPRVPIGADTNREEFKALLSGLIFYVKNEIENRGEC